MKKIRNIEFKSGPIENCSKEFQLSEA